MIQKIRDILIHYKFRPNFRCWKGNKTTETCAHWNYDETWYGGEFFITGFFIHIQLYYFSFHIYLGWWKFKLER